MSGESTYILRGGDAGAERLRYLSEAMRPSTLALLDRARLRPGERVLDLGCGSGEVTVELAKLVGVVGEVVGVDRDHAVLEFARRHAAAAGVAIEWRALDVGRLQADDLEQGAYDLIYARFLFSHLADPATLLERAVAALVPGGRLVLEDIDIEAHACWPDSAAFRRYVEIYAATARLHGADPRIGPRLASLVHAAGLEQIDLSIAMPVFLRGNGKTIARRTLANIADAAVAAGLTKAEEVDTLLDELARHAADPTSLQTTAQVFQVIARRA